MKRLESAPIRVPFNNGRPSSEWERWFASLKTLVDGLSDYTENLNTNTTVDLSGINKNIEIIQRQITVIDSTLLSMQGNISDALEAIAAINNSITIINLSIANINKYRNQNKRVIDQDETVYSGYSLVRGDIEIVDGVTLTIEDGAELVIV